MQRSVLRNVIACLAFCALSSCARKEPIADLQDTKAVESFGPDVVAVVEGTPIRIDDVRELIWAAQPQQRLSPEDACEVLIRNELLVQQGRRMGFERRLEVQDERKVALARLLLERRIGQGITADTIDRRKLRQYYEAHKREYVHGVQRVVHHILVRAPKKDDKDALPSSVIAAEARSALGPVATATQMKEVAEALSEKYRGRVKREELPPCAAEDTIFVKSFIDAVFALKGVGSVSEPFETKFGWHVALVVEELPARNTPFEDIEEELARQVVPEEKKVRYEQLLSELDKRGDVFIYDEVVSQWLNQ